MLKKTRNLLKKYWILSLSIAVALFILLSIIPLRLAIAYQQAPQPQAILTLGGSSVREEFTAKFAREHPSLEIWVSSGIPKKQADEIFQGSNIPKSRFKLDRRAADTVTNFTSLVADFQSLGVHHLYLITSDFHMSRAKAIAFIVLGSRGITFTSVSIPSTQPTESIFHILRDVGRSIIWIFTGHTGASFNPRI